jgi:MFS family permease
MPNVCNPSQRLSDPLLIIAAERNNTRDAETTDSIISVPEISRNVRLTLLYTVLAFAGRSIWSQSVLAAYVYLLRNQNAQAVGYSTAVMGACQLAASIPSGFLADKYRRDTLLKCSSGVAISAIIVTTAACYYESFFYLTVALALWGCFWGVANTALMALFSDSIPLGDRSLYFTQRSIAIILGNTTGPLCALIMFILLRDEWTIHACASVVIIGQVVSLPAVVLLCFFQDEHVSEYTQCQLQATNQQCEADGEDSQQPLLEIDDEVMGNAERDDDNAESTHPLLDTQQTEPSFFVYGCIPQHRRIPVTIAAADLIAGLGSGMSIRYFPIFFLEKLKLGPEIVQLLYILAPLSRIPIMKVNQRLAKRVGRCRVAALFKWIGAFFMFLMISAYAYNWPVWTICACYVLRTAFTNSTGALTRSLLMDNVPSDERGKWSALESVNMFSWSGSAALGGAIVGIVGIVPLFMVTASVQLISTMFLVSLFDHDQKEGMFTSETHADRERASRALM